MKATFETEDPSEIKLMAKASDLADFVWDLVCNMYRRLPEDADKARVFKEIEKSLEDRAIDIFDLRE